MNAPPAPARPGGAAAWLRTREGKIVAGGGGILAVVLLAMMRRGGGGGGFSPTELAGTDDGTVQSQLDQVTGRGGTIDEWSTSAEGLAGAVGNLTDLINSQDPFNKAGNRAELARQAKERGAKVAELHRYKALRDALQAQIPRANARDKATKTAQVKALEGKMRPLQSAIATLNASIGRLQEILQGRG